MLNKLNKNFDSNIKKIKKLKIQLTFTVFLLLIILVIGIFIFLPVSWQKIAIALTGNYSKVSGTDQLTVSDWNNLPNDFLDKQSSSGDTMAGPLNMNGNSITNLGNPSSDDEAVNQGAMNTAISSAISGFSVGESDIKDVSGGELRMVCGKEYINAINTEEYDSVTLHITIDTSSANFSGTGLYFTSISGNGSHYKISGENSIYGLSNAVYSVSDGFDLYLKFNDYNNNNGGVISLADAMNWNWAVNWCGLNL